LKLFPSPFLRIVLSLLIFCMLATGCTTLQTYPGPQLPPEKVATLEGTIHYYGVAIVEFCIFAVDGELTPWWGFNFVLNRGKVEMLPGKHQVTVYRDIGGPKGGSTDNFQRFSFVAEAGHRYKVDGNCWAWEKDAIWIIDKNTEQIVAGKKP